MFHYPPRDQFSTALDNMDTAGVEDLTRWHIVDDQLTWSAAAKANIPIFELDANTEGAVVLRDVSWFTRRTESDGSVVDIGCGARLILRVTGTELKGTLKLPVIAAMAELSLARAHAELEVLGFRDDGGIGKLLPAFQRLDVENFSLWTGALDACRKYMAAHRELVTPEVLRRIPKPSDSDVEFPKAVATVYALQEIADGRSLDYALEGRDQWSSGYAEAVTAAYGKVMPGAASSERPTPRARADARDWLSN